MSCLYVPSTGVTIRSEVILQFTKIHVSNRPCPSTFYFDAQPSSRKGNVAIELTYAASTPSLTYSFFQISLIHGAKILDLGTGGVDAYLAACGPALPTEHPLSKARLEIWDALSAFPLGAMLLRGATFVHLGTTPELLDMMTLRLPAFVEPYGLTARYVMNIAERCDDGVERCLLFTTLAGCYMMTVFWASVAV